LAITREKKEKLVAQYTEMLERSQCVVITEYRGMNMNQLSALRSKLGETNGQFAITKNTLLKIALQNAGMAVPEGLLMGPVAIGLAYDDLSSTVKTLLDASGDDDLALVVKGGIVGQSVFDAKQLERITKLPSLVELRSQLVGLLTSPASQIVGLLEAPARDLVGVIDAGASALLNVVAAYAAKSEGEAAA
jgi:large subunit ribosomal protein L10